MALQLVTGGAGFIGSHLVDALVARGDRVRVLDDLSGGRVSNLEPHEVGGLGSGAQVELVQASIADASACRAACAGVEVVFHQAAQVSVPRSIERPAESYETNVVGTLRVLEGARAAGVRRCIFAASSAAYGETPTLPKVESMMPDPRSPYASGKLAAEELLRVWSRVYGLETVSLRYFNVFGPRQADDSPYTGVIALFARALIEKRAPLILGDGQQTRDFTFVRNVADANLRAAEVELPGGVVINVGGGERISILELFREMARRFDVDFEPEFGPERAGDVKHSQASIALARELLGWRPAIDWRTGLEETIGWYRARARSAAR